MAFHIVKRLLGSEVARNTAKIMEYDVVNIKQMDTIVE